MLQNKELLKNSKNLLAFSAGGDSTALFFLLLENKIDFDIAIVDYALREQSKEEVTYAKELAKTYNLQCHLHIAPKIEQNFEAEARKVRYDFFEKIIQENSYNNLLTAHHLGDRFEWMLMQFCKGAGCLELSGMQAVEQRENYKLIRPLLHLDKQELLDYLHKHNISYFHDASNDDAKYKRNEFRHHYTRPLLEKHLSGIKRSFRYIDADVAELSEQSEVKNYHHLSYFLTSASRRNNIRIIDKVLKSLGHLMSYHEKELLRDNDAVVISRKYIVSQSQKYTFIAPYIKSQNLSKEQKENFRLLKIEPKLRAYLASDADVLLFVSRLLQ